MQDMYVPYSAWIVGELWGAHSRQDLMKYKQFRSALIVAWNNREQGGRMPRFADIKSICTTMTIDAYVNNPRFRDHTRNS